MWYKYLTREIKELSPALPTGRFANAVSTLGQRRRRWANMVAVYRACWVELASHSQTAKPVNNKSIAP